MKTYSLDELLAALRKRAIPLPPSRLEQNVWREIRLRQNPGAWGDFFDWLGQVWTQPRFAGLAIAAAVVVGVGMQGVIPNRASESATSRALSLDVFTAAPSMAPFRSAEL